MVGEFGLKILLFQGLISASIIFTTYLAVSNAPIGDAIAVIFSNPIFTLLFTFVLLRHRHSLWKIGFSILVCIGVIFIVQPTICFGSTITQEKTFQNYQFSGMIFALITAILGGLQSAIIYYLKDINSYFLLMTTAFIGILECLIFGLFYNFDNFLFKNGQWNHSFEETSQLFGLAFLGTFAMLIAIQSYQLIDPCICTVLRSQEIVFAYLFQACVFQETIGMWNLFGGFVVLICGIMISMEDKISSTIFWKYKKLCNNDNNLTDQSEEKELLPIIDIECNK